MIKNLIGIESKACINGVSKKDVIRISQMSKEIPDLEKRVADLENEIDVNDDWIEVDVSTYNKTSALIPELFDYNGDHYFTKYKMMVNFRTKLYMIKENVNIDSPTHLTNILPYSYIITNPTTGITSINYDEVTIKQIFIESSSSGSDKFDYNHKTISFDTDANTFTISNSTGTGYRNQLRVFVNGFKPTGS